MMIDKYELSQKIVNSLFVTDEEKRRTIIKNISVDIIIWLSQKDIFFVYKIDYIEEINSLYYTIRLAYYAEESPYMVALNYFSNLEENFHKNYLLQ